MDRLEALLALLERGASSAEFFLPDGSTPDAIARAAVLLARIAGAAARAHQTVSGEPLDMSKLHELEPVAEEKP